MKFKSNGLVRLALGWFLVVACAVSSFAAPPSSTAAAEAPVKAGGQMGQFPKAFPKYVRQISEAEANFDNKKEQFFIFVPASYRTGSEPFGLIVFIDPGTSCTALPAGWEAVLEQKKLLFIAPQNVGNDQGSKRRNGLALTSALAMLQHYNIDRNRVYAAGFSGGARIASRVAFYAPDIFKGTIQSCGSDFFKQVPKVAVTSADTAAHPGDYGVATISTQEADAARFKTKFVLVTGPKDFRYHYLQDIYNGGFKAGRFKATLLDIPDMGHQTCGAAALESALDFLSQP